MNYYTPIARIQGLTLLELCITLFIMSLIALLNWQGISSIIRFAELSQFRLDQILIIQTIVSQWKHDLDQVIEYSDWVPNSVATTTYARDIDFNGKTIRMTRYIGQGQWSVVAWSVRTTDSSLGTRKMLMRWMSNPIDTRSQWQTAWDQASRWGHNPSMSDLALEKSLVYIDDWQLFLYRDGSWSTPDTGDIVGVQRANQFDGVRLILHLSDNTILKGSINVDWQRNVRGNKS